MITGFNHVGISVSDLDRSIEFYSGLLGMDVMAAPFPFGGPLYDQIMRLDRTSGRMCVLAKGTLALELFEFADPNPTAKDRDYPVSDHGISHFGVTVDDIAFEFERLSSAGVTFHCPVVQFERGIKAAYGRDPDGNVFELLEMPAGR